MELSVSVWTLIQSTFTCFFLPRLPSIASMHFLHFQSMLESSCSGKMTVLGTSRLICPMKWKPTLFRSSFHPGTGPICCSKTCSGVHLGSPMSSWTRAREEATCGDRGVRERHLMADQQEWACKQPPLVHYPRTASDTILDSP